MINILQVQVSHVLPFIIYDSLAEFMYSCEAEIDKEAFHVYACVCACHSSLEFQIPSQLLIIMCFLKLL